jgi:hypothetical protein
MAVVTNKLPSKVNGDPDESVGLIRLRNLTLKNQTKLWLPSLGIALLCSAGQSR